MHGFDPVMTLTLQMPPSVQILRAIVVLTTPSVWSEPVAMTATVWRATRATGRLVMVRNRGEITRTGTSHLKSQALWSIICSG